MKAHAASMLTVLLVALDGCSPRPAKPIPMALIGDFDISGSMAARADGTLSVLDNLVSFADSNSRCLFGICTFSTRHNKLRSMRVVSDDDDFAALKPRLLPDGSHLTQPGKSLLAIADDPEVSKLPSTMPLRIAIITDGGSELPEDALLLRAAGARLLREHPKCVIGIFGVVSSARASWLPLSKEVRVQFFDITEVKAGLTEFLKGV
jgi:hypothetical protein